MVSREGPYRDRVPDQGSNLGRAHDTVLMLRAEALLGTDFPEVGEAVAELAAA